jgi:putative hydrolase of the HAD superfamily
MYAIEAPDRCKEGEGAKLRIDQTKGIRMVKEPRIDTLFLDIGGVLLTNGWDTRARERAVAEFELNAGEMNERHHLTFDEFEKGALDLEAYLDRVVFYEGRRFSRDEFKGFMLAQSQPFPDMIELIAALKARHGLKTIAVNNEARELNEYRIRQFKLNACIDAFVSSCFVHVRKPDERIFRMALDISQAAPERVAYIDDRAMFVDVALSLGIHGIHHTGYESTLAALARLGLE